MNRNATILLFVVAAGAIFYEFWKTHEVTASSHALGTTPQPSGLVRKVVSLPISAPVRMPVATKNVPASVSYLRKASVPSGIRRFGTAML